MKLILAFAASLSCLAAAAQADSTRYFLDQGQQAKQERRYLLAEKQYTQALRFDKDNMEARLAIGDVQMEMKKYTQARATYLEILQKDPQHKVALEKTADLAFMMHQWAETIQYGQQCLDKKIGQRMAYKMAKAYYEQEDFLQASKYLKTASGQEPDNAEVPYMMANIWVDMNNAKKAIEMYEIALSIDTNNANWHYEFALVCQQVDENKKTIEHLEKAIQKGFNTNLDVYITLGNAYLAQKNFDKGMFYMKQVLAKKPMDKVLLNDIAYAYYNAEKYDDAIKWWDDILVIDKQNAKALFMIGVAFQKKGDKDKGTRLCDAAIQIDPSLAKYKKEKIEQNMGL
jgi:tetratricopeptide (TPR) repeat protein